MTRRRVPNGSSIADRIRFHAWVDDATGCWMWTDRKDRHGYGTADLYPPGGTHRTLSAHVLAFETFVGPVPEGLELDHTCHGASAYCRGGRTCLHRACVNPDHLEPVTHAENLRRGRARRQAVSA